jgi:hypothetical protein
MGSLRKLFDKPLKFNGKISLSHKICCTPWYFGQHMSMAIFSGKRYFNDIWKSLTPAGDL